MKMVRVCENCFINVASIQYIFVDNDTSNITCVVSGVSCDIIIKKFKKTDKYEAIKWLENFISKYMSDDVVPILEEM